MQQRRVFILLVVVLLKKYVFYDVLSHVLVSFIFMFYIIFIFFVSKFGHVYVLVKLF